MYQHTVHYYETDKMGITHHSNYIRFMEEARVAFLDEIGFSFTKLEEMGLVSPVLHVDCDYKLSTTFSDVINIDVYVEELKNVRMRIGYEMTNSDGKVVLTGHTEHCFLNEKGFPVRLNKEYPEFLEALQKHIKVTE